MFKSFSKSLEIILRIFFIGWISFWTLFGIYDSIQDFIDSSPLPDLFLENFLTELWVARISLLISVVIGGVLLYLTIGISQKISNKRKVTNLTYMTLLVIVYHLSNNVTRIASNILLYSGYASINWFGLIAWLTPGFLVFLVHLLYLSNLKKYNSELEKA
jgi:hypothetical protein